MDVRKGMLLREQWSLQQQAVNHKRFELGLGMADTEAPNITVDGPMERASVEGVLGSFSRQQVGLLIG